MPNCMPEHRRVSSRQMRAFAVIYLSLLEKTTLTDFGGDWYLIHSDDYVHFRRPTQGGVKDDSTFFKLHRRVGSEGRFKRKERGSRTDFRHELGDIIYLLFYSLCRFVSNVICTI